MIIKNVKLSDDEIDIFLAKIKVKRGNNSLVFLNKIISGIFAHIPFQNLTLINAKKDRMMS